MTIGEAIILGLVQGLTEFLPISSSGHLILMRELFGVGLASGLTFDALLHVATLLAICVYFWRDIVAIVHGAIRFVVTRAEGKEQAILAGVLVVATLPAAVAGFFLEGYMETVFRDARLIALTLVLGAGIMYMAEKVLQQRVVHSEALTFTRGILVGLFQSLALIPGMSRSGMTIAGGIFMGLSREQAARFAFLLAIPILAGAGLKKVLELRADGMTDEWLVVSVGAVAAFVSGLAVVHWLMQFLRTKTLMPFVWYRVALAIVVVLAVL